MALRHSLIRHSDVLLVAQGGDGRVVDRRLQGQSVGALSSFHLTPESFIK